ncbi:MAG: hypothetical protein PHO65_01295 [Sulfurovum sp.]|nr:hypothetical protein [Sulfurovum sp.]
MMLLTGDRVLQGTMRVWMAIQYHEEGKMKKWIGAIALFVMGLGSAFGYDNGPQTIGCDYKFGENEGTEICLVVGSGMHQGISWVVFKVESKRFRYKNSSPDSIELIDKAGNTIATHQVNHSYDQCRPGGRDADKYVFTNGDRICLYW